jgi:hypothetical protein
MTGVTLRTKKKGSKHQPLEIKGVAGHAAHLKLEKPRFLFLGGLGVPPSRLPAPAGASTDDPVAGASALATSTRSMAAPAAYGDGGGGFHLSGAARPPSLSSSSSSSDDEFAGASGGESPCYSRSRYSSSYCSRCSRHQSLLSFARAARSYSRRCAARAADRARGVGESDHTACTVTRC